MKKVKIRNDNKARDMLKSIQSKLELIKFPEEKRRNVLRDQNDRKGGFLLGYTPTFTGTIAVTGMTRKHPDLYLEILQYARYAFPRFEWNSIQVNTGGSALHVDKSNCGLSVIVAMGDFSKGQLWTWPDDVIDIKNTAQIIDGTYPHMTLPGGKGKRFSLVFFRQSQILRNPVVTEGTQDFLNEIGLSDMKYIQPDSACTKPHGYLLPEAAEKLKNRGVTKIQIGDFMHTKTPTRYRSSS